jgi:hypothetical protein
MDLHNFFSSTELEITTNVDNLKLIRFCEGYQFVFCWHHEDKRAFYEKRSRFFSWIFYVNFMAIYILMLYKRYERSFEVDLNFLD